MSNIEQPSLLDEYVGPGYKAELDVVKALYKETIDKFAQKLNTLIDKLIETETENLTIKETIKELTAKMQELKMETTRVKTESVEKDKEISNLKNKLMLSQSGKSSLQDSDNVRSRIKELITRIDTHLEHQEIND